MILPASPLSPSTPEVPVTDPVPTPPPSAEEEVVGAGRESPAGTVYDGLRLYLTQIGPWQRMDREEEARLAVLARAGDGEARDRIISAHLRLVVRLARPYTRTGLPLLDLIAEGNTGLIKAVDRYDPGQGFRFSSYAAWWIRHAITDYVAAHARLIRVPVQHQGTLARIYEALVRLQELLGRSPSLDEVAEDLGMPAPPLAAFFRVVQHPVSLDAESTEAGDRRLGERLEDPRAASPLELADQQDLRCGLGRLLAELSSREREVLERRFGLADGTLHSRAEIGRSLGLTREAVRLIELKALRKLRHPSRRHGLPGLSDSS